MVFQAVGHIDREAMREVFVTVPCGLPKMPLKSPFIWKRSIAAARRVHFTCFGNSH